MPSAGTNDNSSAVEAILQWPPPGYGPGTAAAYTTAVETYLANYSDFPPLTPAMKTTALGSWTAD